MNHLTIYRHPELGEVRTLAIDGEPWFVGKDVAQILGYSNASKAVMNHVEAEDKQFMMMGVADSQNGNLVKTAVINESGLYSLILSSKLPSAKEFKRWVTSVILPAIRKTGGYIAGEEKMDDDLLVAQALLVVNRKLEERTAQLEAAQSAIEKLAPKADYYDTVTASEGSTNFRETAKLFGIPEKKFTEFVVRFGYCYRDNKNRLMPYAEYTKNGWFELRETTYSGKEGVKTAVYARITPRGRQGLFNRAKKEAIG